MTLQCRNKLLVDKLGPFQNGGERGAVGVVQYEKRREQMNLKEVRLAIAEAGMPWDPDK